ncbi:MAG: hypothetical protein AAB553_02035 [Patescibacteria group bacterium]
MKMRSAGNNQEQLSKNEVIPQLFSLLQEIDKNLLLLRKTRKQMRQKHPKLFSA